MTRKLFLAGAALVSLGFSHAALAQASAQATASGSTTIIRPVTVTKTADLQFGRIVKPATGDGTVSMANAADAVTAGSGAMALSGTTSRAKFTINGEGAMGVSLTVPASFEMSNGTDQIVVTLDPDLGATTTLSGAAGAAGTKALNVGGSFSVPAAISTGAFVGTFDVTVAYN